MLAAAAAPPDPYAIYDRARTYWDDAVYPRSLAYEIVVTVKRNAVVSSAHYHAYYDTLADKVTLNAVSDEESEHPYTPRGIKTAINLSLYGVPLKSIPLSAPERTFDYLGVPVLSPTFSFGMAHALPHTQGTNPADLIRQIRAQFHDQEAARSPVPHGALKTIASVAVARRSYTIVLAGMTPVAGHVDYHLRLTPVRDPSRYRIRELFINTQTFATDRMCTQGNFTAGQLAAIPWVLTFRQVGGAPLIESEQSASGFVFDRRRYDGASVSFTMINAQGLPPYASLSTFATNAQTAPEILAEPATE